ncbi:hypothetical protein CSC31_0321 [Pseudomonas aeruginosa]|nr:hypothetical protein CSC31_0321 [Pseudomonas aeruginosa]
MAGGRLRAPSGIAQKPFIFPLKWHFSIEKADWRQPVVVGEI